MSLSNKYLKLLQILMKYNDFSLLKMALYGTDFKLCMNFKFSSQPALFKGRCSITFYNISDCRLIEMPW